MRNMLHIVSRHMPRRSVVFVGMIILQLLAYSKPGLGQDGGITAVDAVGPELVRDINALRAGRDVTAMMTTEQGIYFAIDDRELWFSNGTQAGTRQLATSEYQMDLLEPFAGGILFSTDVDAYSGRPIWYSDGVSVRQLVNESRLLAVFDDGFLAWRAERCTDIDNYYELIRVDARTFEIQPMRHFLRADIRDTGFTARTDTHVFFVATDYRHYEGTTYGRELWQSDGSVLGTRLAFDLAPGSADSDISTLIPTDELLYFVASNGPVTSLWRYDPSTARPIAQEPAPNLANLAVGTAIHDGQEVVFAATSELDPYSAGRPYKLWYTDGTAAQTRQLADLNGDARWTVTWPQVHWIGHKSNSVQGGGTLGWWMFDVNAKTTTTLHVFEENASSLHRQEISAAFVLLDNLVWAFTEQPVNLEDYLWEYAIWTSDGTIEGTQEYMRLDGAPSFPSIYREVPYFWGFDAAYGYGFFALDVAQRAMSIEVALTSSTQGSNPGCFVTAGGHVFFSAYTFDAGEELWASDGTAANTRMVADLHAYNDRLPDWGWSTCTTPDIVGGQIFEYTFAHVENEEATRATWWAVDPVTLELTELGQHVFPGQDIGIEYQTVATTDIYFGFRDGTYLDPSWWHTDGTPAGTGFVYKENGDLFRARPRYHQIFVAGEAIYFVEEQWPDIFNLWRVSGDRAELLRSAQVGPSDQWRIIPGDDRIFLILEEWEWESGTLLRGQLGLILNDGDALLLLGQIDGYDTFDTALIVNGDLFVAQSDFSAGDQEAYLFYSDGTAAGTGPVELASPLGERAVMHHIESVAGTYFILLRTSSSYTGWLLVRWAGSGTQAQQLTQDIGEIRLVDGRILAVTADVGQVGWLNGTTGSLDPAIFDRANGVGAAGQQSPAFDYLTEMHIVEMNDGRLLINIGGSILLASDGTRAGTYRLSPENTQIDQVFPWSQGVAFVSRTALWHSPRAQEVASMAVLNDAIASDRVATVNENLLFSMSDAQYGTELFTLTESSVSSGSAGRALINVAGAEAAPLLSVSRVGIAECDPIYLPHVVTASW